MNLPQETVKHTEVPDDWFQPGAERKGETESVKRPSLSYSQDAWRRLKKNKLAMAGLVILSLPVSIGCVRSADITAQRDKADARRAESSAVFFTLVRNR